MEFEYTLDERPVSSWISGIYYNEGTRELAVNAHGRTYIYLDVPPEVFEDFQTSYSAGSVYNARVVGQYTPKFSTGRRDVSMRKVEKVEKPEQKAYKVRATVAFEAEVTAGSLEDAVKEFLESNKDIPGIEITEVVVPFGK